MPADTRSSRKAKHDDAGIPEKLHSKEGSENATGSKRSTRETSSKKQDSSSPSSTRKSERLKTGDNQGPNPSPIRRSERAKNTPQSGQSEKSPSFTDTTHNSHKRKRPANEEINQGVQRGKSESNASSQRTKILPAHHYRDLFKTRKEPKASDSAKGRRVVPCTSSSNSGGSTKHIPVAEDHDLNEDEGKRGEDYAESTSKANGGGLDFDLKEVASGTPKGQNNVEPHSVQKPLNSSVEVCIKPETHAHTNLEEDLRLDAQVDCEANKCIICKFAGKLLCCGGKGCRRRCHPACLNSCWKDVYPGTWHCPFCTKNKIESGVVSVSEGIESIWDVRGENAENYEEGAKRQKEYFVKYKGLAHVHNCWLPEQRLLQEAPELVAEFVQRETAIKWRQEWSEPHRLLLKRTLMLPKSDGCAAEEVGSLNCQHEWLVKWCGLDYNEITWELENAVLFQRPKALDLVKEYERRHEKARRSSVSQEVDEKKNKRKDFSIELSTLPSGCDTSYMIFSNKLREYWSRGDNVLIIDEQVQSAEIIHFILTLKKYDVSRPFLVIAPSSSVSKWEAAFSSVAPSINAVVYNGNRDAREMIRMLEFDENGPCVMFEVLLSTMDIIKEDWEFIKCIRWESIIMDERQKSESLPDSLFMKKLASGSMILLLMDQINENVIDCCNILSLLKCNLDACDVDGPQVDSDSSLTILREKLSPFIVSGPNSPKSGSLRLVEYWVPVQMSNTQLEQYCSSLLTNLPALCSKNDPIGHLREILISTRKCCDHPYIIDSNLQGRLVDQRTLQAILDIGGKASGKFYLLDAILTKMKDQEQKVVILFKSLGGSGRDLLGEILEDFVGGRFGQDSYERVDGGGIPSRKQASLAKFNEEKGRFIFLLETRACSPSIKLSSVDAVIILGSDWNPLNDLKALQKIKIDSKLEIKVFRLYTLCTIEEKVLFLSKRSILLESTLQGIGFSTSQMLLTWGASYLFKKLDEFHDCDGSPEILPRNLILKDVLQEFTSLLQKHGTCTSTKFISRAWQKGGSYSKDVSLLGEQYSHWNDEEPARVFWAKLLDGRQPVWRYLPTSSQRNRKRVQYYEGTSETDVQTNEAIKRQKKMGNTNGEPCSPRGCNDVGSEPVSGLFGTFPRNGTQLSPKSGCVTASAQKKQADISSFKQCDEQKNLHEILKCDLVKLFQILGLEEDVQKMAERFLAFLITTNQRVSREPDTTFQAFQISLCWTAASILNKKLDHVETISLARGLPNFNCSNAEAEYEFLKMQFSKLRFVRSEGANLQASSKNIDLQAEGLKSETMNGVREPTLSMQQKENVAKGLPVQEGFVEQALAPKQTVEQTGEGLKILKKITKSCRKRLACVIEKQLNEVEEVKKRCWERKNKRAKKTACRSEVIHKINSGNEAVKSDKLKILEDHHRQKLHQYDLEMDTTLKDIEARHLAEREEVEKEEKVRVQELYGSDFWIKSGLSDNLQFKEAFEKHGIEVIPVNNSSLSGNTLEEENANVKSSADTQVPLSQNPEPHNDAECSASAEGAAVPVERERIISDNDTISNSPPTAADTQVPLSQNPEPHNAAERSASAEDAAVPVERKRIISDNDTTSNSPPTAAQINNEAKTFTNIGERTVPDSCGVQGIHVSSAATTDEVEQIATSKNGQLPVKNPALQTEVDANAEIIVASERYSASRKEQHDEACSTHIESTGTPSVMDPSVVQPVANQHQVNSLHVSLEHATSCARLDQLNSQHTCVETSGIQNTIIQDTMSSSYHSVGVPCNASVRSLPSELAVPMDTAVAHSVDVTQPCLPSSGLPENHLPFSSLPFQTTVARVQEDQRPSNRSVEATPRPLLDASLNPLLHNSSQFENHTASRSLPATLSGSYLSQGSSKEFDPLQREYERICGESNQVSKNHEEMVSGLKLECDKEIEEIVAQIRKKYDSMLQEANASHLQKKNELDHIQRKVVMNIALAEAFRSKCIDHRVAPGAQQAVPSRLTLQLLQSQFAGRSVSPAAVGPQTATAQPTHNANHSMVQTSTMPATLPHRNGLLSSGNRMGSSEVRLLPPLRESLNLSMPMTSTPSHAFSANRPLNSTLRSQPLPLLPQSQPQIYLTGSNGGTHLAGISARPMPALQTSVPARELLMTPTDQSAVRSTAAPLPPLPEIARNFDSLNLSEFETSLDARQPDNLQAGGVENGLVHLSDDE